ncbi:MAG TPA: hypothetical protein VK436_03825 [Methanocella sp.]|nr:hypothetical protein [Methanocella sp.]
MVESVAYRKAPITPKAVAILCVVAGTILLIVGILQWLSGNIKETTILIPLGIFIYPCAILALYPNPKMITLLYTLTGTYNIILGLWYYSGGFDHLIQTTILVIYGVGLYTGIGLSLYNMDISLTNKMKGKAHD